MVRKTWKKLNSEMYKNKKVDFFQTKTFPLRVIAKSKGFGSIMMGNKSLAFKRMKIRIKR